MFKDSFVSKQVIVYFVVCIQITRNTITLMSMFMLTVVT